jgi:hypothetical protein
MRAHTSIFGALMGGNADHKENDLRLVHRLIFLYGI